jgi:hypothetical protein
MNPLRQPGTTEFCREVNNFKYTILSRDGSILCHLPEKAGWMGIFLFWTGVQPLDYL